MSFLSMNTKLPLFVVFGAVVLAAGCTFPSSTSVYDRNAAGRSMSIDTGDVIAVRSVQVSGRSTVVGTGGGALMGSAAASGGGGVGGAVVQAAGAIGGAVMGEAVEEKVTRKNAQEITIKLNNGGTIAVVQPVSQEGSFAVGEHVQVMQGGAGTTVRRLY
jgi:outer membrane lipoprotein SlyB